MADTATDTTTTTETIDPMQAQIAAITSNADFKLGDKVELPEPEVVEPTTQGAEAPEIDDDIYEEAERIGLSKEDVRDLGEARTLRLILKAGRAKEPAPEPEQATTKQVEDLADQLGIDLTDDDVDPKILGQLKKMVEFNNKQSARLSQLGGKFKDFDALREQVKSVSGFVQNAQEAQRWQFLDQQIESLGADWADVLGKGPTTRLEKGSKHFQARKALLDDVMEYGRSRQARGENPDPAVIFKKMLAANHSDHQQTLARRKIEPQLRDQRGQYTTPPRSGKPTPADPNAREAQRIAEIVANPDYKYGAD